MEDILKLDYWLFETINQAAPIYVIEQLLILVRHPIFWIPLYLFIVSFLVFNFKEKAYWIILFSLLTFGTSDMVSSQLIKKSVQRLRPCRTEAPIQVTTRVYCGSGYSFTSSHATNHFAIAVFWMFVLGKYIKWVKIPLIFWAGIISYAQVFVGVHFPTDVLVGSIIGCMIGYLWAALYARYYENKLQIT